MTGPTIEFFDDLSHREHEPLLERITATVRFDIADHGRTEHRLARIDHGDIRVTAQDAPADCVMGGDRAVFDAIIGGHPTAMAALPRGVLALQGGPEPPVFTQRPFSRTRT